MLKSRFPAADARHQNSLHWRPAASISGPGASVRLLLHRMWGGTRLALAAGVACALLLTQTVPAFSHECDQYTLPAGRDFADLGPYFSRIVYGAIEEAAAETNAAVGSALEAAQSTQEIEDLLSADSIAGKVWGHLFAAFPALELLDITLVSEPVRAQYPGLVTMYRPVESIYDDPLLLLDITKAVRTFFRAGTVSAGGMLFGTDKIIHFIHLGRIYHARYLDRIRDGLTEEHAAVAAVSDTSSNPLLSEDGILGMWTTGIHSNGDLAADYAGCTFYRNLTETVRIGGRVMPPMLVREGPYLRVRIEPDSDFFTAFITPHWNEVLNPNKYVSYISGRVRTVIRDRCPDVFDWYRDERGQQIGRAQFEALQRELSTFYGEAYGYGINEEDPVSIAGACFAQPASADQPEGERNSPPPALEQTPPTRFSWGATAPAAPPRNPDALGRSTLWWAAAGGRAEEVARIAARGEDTNAPDCDGETPLHAAARSGNAMAAQVLLAHGANPDRAALYGVTPLMLAAAGGQTEVAAALLKAGADPNARDLFGKTPLHEAALRGNRPLTELLLAHGADPSLADDAGNTALQMAAPSRNEAIMSALQSHGAAAQGVGPADSGPASAGGSNSENAR